MTIFALDTSSRAASCALLREGTLAGEFFLHTGLTHSQTALPMARQLLASAGLRVQDIDLFAVAAGPGSFTGLRIGIGAVKGMAMAADRPCVAVSTLEALAENLLTLPGYLLPVMDARRSQVYAALFHSDGERAQRLWDDTAVPIESLGERLDGLQGAAVTLLGDGAELCARQLSHMGGLRLAQESLRHQRAGSVARVAARLAAQGKTCTPGALAPAYLRLPQAERERLARLQQPDA